MTGNGLVALGATFAGLAVALGAFGAHGLRARVTPEMLAVFETGVRYQFYHAAALLLLGVFAISSSRASAASVPGASAAAWCFVVGIVLFSGSLYVMAIGGMRWLGAVTPFGGISFLIGWLLFARAALR
jgi:uncharacterized membrane protein YgdD (TMEM256/DUF423 family)